MAINVNELSPNDTLVVLRIKCNCLNELNANPYVNSIYYSVNSGERIFPPFSFFKIESIVENDGNPGEPYIIYMSIPNKKELIELGLKNGKSVYYKRNENLLYCS